MAACGQPPVSTHLILSSGNASFLTKNSQSSLVKISLVTTHIPWSSRRYLHRANTRAVFPDPTGPPIPTVNARWRKRALYRVTQIMVKLDRPGVNISERVCWRNLLFKLCRTLRGDHLDNSMIQCLWKWSVADTTKYNAQYLVHWYIRRSKNIHTTQYSNINQL